MAVAAQTITRNDLRAFAFTRDTYLRNNRDHVFSHSPGVGIFLAEDLGDFGGIRMRGSGKKNQTGGHTVNARVRLGKHDGSKVMAGAWDTHSTSPDDNTRLAQANWTHYSGAVVVSDTDKAQNAGADAMASFIADQTESVMLSLVDTVGDHLFGSSNPTGSVTSFRTLVGAGSGTVQTLSGTSYDNYNSRGVSARGTAAASISFASGSFAVQGLADLRTSYNNASEGIIQPNVCLTSYGTHERYEGVLQPQERYAGTATSADASFQALAFRQTPVVADPKVTDGDLFWFRVGDDGVQMICLNPFSFKFAPFKPSSNQEVFVSELQFKANTFIHNRRYGSNRLSGITD